MSGKLSSPDYLDFLSRAVAAHLEQRMGAPTLKTVNFHLKQICGMDLSQVTSNPLAVEKGLLALFGRGAEEIIRAAILAAFRAARLVPGRDYVSLQDAFTELQTRISPASKNSLDH